MNKNRIRGVTKQGEQASNCEALVAKAVWRKSGGCGVKECVLTWGELVLCLKGRRSDAEREVSRGRSSINAKGQTGRSGIRVVDG